MSLKFGLSLKNKAPNSLSKPGVKPAQKKKKPLFDDEEDTKPSSKDIDKAQEIGEFNFDDTITTTPEPSKPTPRPKKGAPPAPPSRKPIAKPDDPTLLLNSASAKEAEQRALDALKHDAKIYDYDSAYDALHAATAMKKAAEASDPLARAPKYMDSLFNAAEQRKADQARARDKLLQRERENEGDEFADKEKFVTGAYKTQQEENARLEIEEAKRVEKEEEDRKKHGMAGFHKRMLEEREKRHREAVEAAEKASREGIVLPTLGDDEEKKTEMEQVEELRKQGKDILLNEEGQVADKRQLLKGGLNIIAKPKPPPSATAAAAATKSTLPTHIASKAGRGAQRERQTQMVAQQIEAAAKRKADEEAEEQAKLLHASKSQKTQTDIMSAKERYLQRKREAAAAKEKAGK
jgi:coiled-coil domain-containing protein 55